MRTISKQPISPGKLNLDELLQLLEEKDEILKQMVERVKNQENQILMLLKEGENGLAKQVSRVPYSVYREFVEQNQSNQKFIVVRMIQKPNSKNPTIYLSNNLELIPTHSRFERLANNRSHNIRVQSTDKAIMADQQQQKFVKTLPQKSELIDQNIQCELLQFKEPFLESKVNNITRQQNSQVNGQLQKLKLENMKLGNQVQSLQAQLQESVKKLSESQQMKEIEVMELKQRIGELESQCSLLRSDKTKQLQQETISHLTTKINHLEIELANLRALKVAHKEPNNPNQGISSGENSPDQNGNETNIFQFSGSPIETMKDVGKVSPMNFQSLMKKIDHKERKKKQTIVRNY